MTGSIVEIEGLVKSYGPEPALRGLSLEVGGGPVGLLGPNGAGKTTLLRVLLGLVRPDGGRVRVVGSDPTSHAGRLAIRRAVGYMPEGDCLAPDMNGLEIVRLLGRLSGLSARLAMTRAHEVLDYVGIEEARYRAVDGYSTGMKQRLKLAQVLVHDPELLLLDEPTDGLDPKGRAHMLELVHDLGHAQSKCVLLCSHLLPDVERTCDRFVLLHRGRVLEEGVLGEAESTQERWVVAVTSGDSAAFERELHAAGLEHARDAGGGHRIRVGERGADDVFRAAARAAAVVLSLGPVHATLEDVFLEAVAEAEA